jgi:hypothetical protein
METTTTVISVVHPTTGETMTFSDHDILALITNRDILKSNCEASNRALETLRQTYSVVSTNYREDMDLLGKELLEWSENEGRSSEYDQFVHEINDHLNMKLDERVREFLVTQSWLVTRSITVNALDDEDASDKANKRTIYGVDDLEQDDWTVDSITMNEEEIEEN